MSSDKEKTRHYPEEEIIFYQDDNGISAREQRRVEQATLLTEEQMTERGMSEAEKRHWRKSKQMYAELCAKTTEAEMERLGMCQEKRAFCRKMKVIARQMGIPIVAEEPGNPGEPK